MHSRRKAICTFLLALVLIISALRIPSTITKAAGKDDNAYNIVIVLDISGSMLETDPENLRYEAIELFTNLVAETGNYLGGIAFSSEVSVRQKPILISSAADREKLNRSMREVKYVGYTNIGDALLKAVEVLNTYGDQSLPKAIVFLSDGSTEMWSEKSLKLSLEHKAEAIENARESNIPIYSVCLNVNGNADIGEMEQISGATGGFFKEVRSPEDLTEVFNSFYNLIYGTSTIGIVDEAFPSTGIIEKKFTVPGIGVEEVNIIIEGKTNDLVLYDPDNNPVSTSVSNLSSMSLIKLKNVMPGEWRIVTTGNKEDRIKINLVFNTKLSVDVEVDKAGAIVDDNTPVKVKSYLRCGDMKASQEKQYRGFDGILTVYDVYDEVLDRIPMQIVNDHFECEKTFGEGFYKFKVNVYGNGIERESEITEPLKVVKAEKVEEEKVAPPNTAPTPVEEKVKESINIWPFKTPTLEIDMSSLVSDIEDENLTYKIVSSSFKEGTDYTVEDNKIVMKHFSLSKGSFEIKAVDSEGLSCKVDVVVVTHNITLIATIGLGIAILIGLAVFAFLLHQALTKPFRGKITAQSYCGGVVKGVQITGRRGRLKLAAFHMDPTGLDYARSYFQATGDNNVILVTDKPVTYNGMSKTKFVIANGIEHVFIINPNENKQIRVRFDSSMKGGVRKSSVARPKSAFGAPKAPMGSSKPSGFGAPKKPVGAPPKKPGQW